MTWEAYENNIFYFLWAQPESYLMVTTFTGRLLIQQATFPHCLFPLLLLYHLPKYKDISNPLPLTPPNQSIVYDSQRKLRKEKSQERDSPKSGLLVLIIPSYEGLVWPHTVALCNLFWGANSDYMPPSFPFETLRFQGHFCSSSNASNSVCVYMGHC